MRARLTATLRAACSPPPARLGVAVSGGGDSLALLHLLADWAGDGGPQLAAVTVDHGLRPAAAAEAALAAAECTARCVPHQTLRWQGWDGHGNLMDAARRARLSLIAEWAAGQGIGAVALGHTADDQAETLLMRLARGSGVDGLAGMAPLRRSHGVDWLRPLLAVSRADLRADLVARGVVWAEDPSNDDLRFDRVRARAALNVLASLGLTRARLTDTADRMALARHALEAAALHLARRAARIAAGDVVFTQEALQDAPEETQLRLLAHAIRWVAVADYRPRLATLRAVRDDVFGGGRRTLAGCILSAAKGVVRVGREPRAAAAAAVALPGAVWDGRWCVEGPQTAGAEVRALGTSGLARCPGWRKMGLPRTTLLASPGVWLGETLLAAPLARAEPLWRALPATAPEQFYLLILSH